MLAGRSTMTGWTRAQQRVRVMRLARHDSDPDPVRFVTGEVLSIGHHDQQWRTFVWCTDQSGHAGWVPDSLEMTGAAEATALRDYDATELTVSKGEILEVLEEVGGWVFCRTPPDAPAGSVTPLRSLGRSSVSGASTTTVTPAGSRVTSSSRSGAGRKLLDEAGRLAGRALHLEGVRPGRQRRRRESPISPRARRTPRRRRPAAATRRRRCGTAGRTARRC